jgi:hypothetical protein
VNEAAITSLVSLIAAIIGLITAIVTAFAKQPRAAQAPTAGHATATAPPWTAASPQTTLPPQTTRPPQTTPPPDAGVGPPQPYAPQQAYARQWAPPAGSAYGGTSAPAPHPAALKISRSLWLGIVGLLLLAAVWVAPLLCYCCVVPGIWIAIRDLRSPGTRRLAAAGLAVCGVAFAGALADSIIYFATLKTHL